MPAATIQTTPATRILLVSSDQVPLAAWREALVAKGASCTLTNDPRHAAELGRKAHFDVILVAARASHPETVLLGQLLRGTALGRPRLSLVSRRAGVSHGMEFDGHSPAEPAKEDAEALLSADAAAAAPVRRVAVSPGISLTSCPAPWLFAAPQQCADAIVAQGERDKATLLADMPAARAAVVPIIAVGASPGLRGDVHVRSGDVSDLTEALSEVEPIVSAVERLAPAWFGTTDPRVHVLARLAVRSGAAHPVRDASRSAGIYHPDEAAIPAFRAAAEELVRTGHLKHRFFDRVHVCPQCDSARLNVREECARCRSGDVVEEAILHHLRCGYQGPQRDFQDGRALVCPKCRNYLEHFSVDYDKPGFLYCCNGCGHVTGDTAIGFVCLDCSAQTDTSQVETRTYYSYELTELGRDKAFMPPRPETSDACEARGQILSFAAAQRGHPHAILMVGVDPGKDVLGPDLWAKTMALAHSLLLEVFSDEVEIVPRGTTFVALIPGESPDHVRAAAPAVVEHVRSMLRPPATVSHDVLGPDQLALFL